MNKFLSIFLIAVTYCDISTADNYAILISAGEVDPSAPSDIYNYEYWYDLYLAYEYLLLEEKYDSSKVFVFYGNGYDYITTNNRYRKESHNWGQITDYNNSYSTMYSIISSLNNIITDNDNLLFYWVTGHGGIDDLYSEDSYCVFINNINCVEVVNKTQLASLINSITHYNKRKIFWMTCYSGALGSGAVNVNNNKTTLVTSSTADEISYSFIFNDEPHSIFNYALYSLSTRYFPNGTACILDQYCPPTAIADSLLSIHELFSGISTFISLYPDFSSSPQHPCIYDFGSISNKLFIGEDKIMSNVTINANSSYWLDKMEVSDAVIDEDINISIDIDRQSIIKKNTFVPMGTSLIIK